VKRALMGGFRALEWGKAMVGMRVLGCAVLFLSLIGIEPASAQISSLRNGPIPTLAPLVREVTPAVVNISVQGRIREDNPLYRDPFFREYFDIPKQIEKEVKATGSGVIVDAQRGYVLTANHVVAQISTVQITTKDGLRFVAKLVGRDPATDLAVLQIQNPSGLKSITLGSSDALEVGDFVIAIGNPFGLGQTVTSGLVSALGRTGLGKQGYEDFIQTDAAINPGNSGGALVNLKGELVGINTAIISPGGGNVGIGFAVPINMAHRVMQQILATGKVERGQIGVVMQDVNEAQGANSPGVRIVDVAKGSSAERAGLRKGDFILSVDERPVRSAAQLRNAIGLARIGERVRLAVLRERTRLDVSIDVAPVPAAARTLSRD
jgi:serine protease Do